MMVGNRKADHVEICATKPVLVNHNYWEDIFLVHQSLPELNKSEINLKVKLFKKRLDAPIIISGMTGGYPKAKKINSNLAEAASEFQIGFGLGSQRPALESVKLVDTYNVVKEFDIPLVIGNIGSPQLVQQNKKHKPFTITDCKTAMDMIDADLLAIHMNFVQEIVQPEGDTNAKGCLTQISQLAKKLPILAKETGAGISAEIAKKLKTSGVLGLDVGGLSGTSFSAVETYRGRTTGDHLRTRLGETYWNWGIPTPVSLFEAKVGLPLIATGGMNTGLDVAKSLCLGASAAGFARRLLKPAMKSAKSVKNELKLIIEELRSALFLTGAGNVKDLKLKRVIITGKTRELLLAMGY